MKKGLPTRVSGGGPAAARRPLSRASVALGLFLGLAASGAVAAAPGPQERPRFGVEAQLVLVDVTVARDGRPLQGLRIEDFSVFEDGKEQEILQFEEVLSPVTERQPEGRPFVVLPRSFVLVLDELHLTVTQAEAAKRAMTRFLWKGTEPGDLVAVISVAEAKHARAEMPDGRQALAAFLGGLRGRYVPETSREIPTEPEAFRITKGDPMALEAVVQRIIHEESWASTSGRARSGDMRDSNTTRDAAAKARRRALDVFHQVEQRTQATLRVLSQALDWVAQWRGRKAFILASKGFIDDPALPDFRDVTRRALRANGVFYFLDVRGLHLGEVNRGVERGPGVLTTGLLEAIHDGMDAASGAEVLAINSGGFVVNNTNGLEAGLGRIAADASVYYFLGYEPKARRGNKDKLRKIEVKLRQADVDVRHRRAY